MNRSELENILEESIGRLEAGESLEEVLSSYPKHSQELRNLLLATYLVHNFAGRIGQPDDVRQTQSRRRFITDAARLDPSPQSFWVSIFLFLRRGSVAALLVLLFLFSGLFGIGVASANALPGDILYPLKLAVEKVELNLAGQPEKRLSQEEEFDRNRVSEVKKLISRDQTRVVKFAGYLEKMGEMEWSVAGIPIQLGETQDFSIEAKPGVYVEVQGITSSQSVLVGDIQYRLFHLNGRLEEGEPGFIELDGLELELPPGLSSEELPEIGQKVVVTVIRTGPDRLMILKVSKNGGRQLQQAATPQMLLEKAKNNTQDGDHFYRTGVPSGHGKGISNIEKASKKISTVPPGNTVVPLETSIVGITSTPGPIDVSDPQEEDQVEDGEVGEEIKDKEDKEEDKEDKEEDKEEAKEDKEDDKEDKEEDKEEAKEDKEEDKVLDKDSKVKENKDK